MLLLWCLQFVFSKEQQQTLITFIQEGNQWFFPAVSKWYYCSVLSEKNIQIIFPFQL